MKEGWKAKVGWITFMKLQISGLSCRCFHPPLENLATNIPSILEFYHARPWLVVVRFVHLQTVCLFGWLHLICHAVHDRSSRSVHHGRIRAPKLAAIALDFCGVQLWSWRQLQDSGEGGRVHQRAVEEVVFFPKNIVVVVRVLFPGPAPSVLKFASHEGLWLRHNFPIICEQACSRVQIQMTTWPPPKFDINPFLPRASGPNWREKNKVKISMATIKGWLKCCKILADFLKHLMVIILPYCHLSDRLIDWFNPAGQTMRLYMILNNKIPSFK